jgi:hypothetical protein
MSFFFLLFRICVPICASTCNDFPTFTFTNAARLGELVIHPATVHHPPSTAIQSASMHGPLRSSRAEKDPPRARCEKPWSQRSNQAGRHGGNEGKPNTFPNSTILRQTSPLSANHTGAPTQHLAQPPLLPIDGDNSAHVLTSSCPRSCWEELEGGDLRATARQPKNQSEP